MVISVKAVPKARQNKISEIGINSYKIWVTAVPSDGKANKAIVQLLAKYFRVPKSNITITKGIASREKMVKIEGI